MFVFSHVCMRYVYITARSRRVGKDVRKVFILTDKNGPLFYYNLLKTGPSPQINDNTYCPDLDESVDCWETFNRVSLYLATKKLTQICDVAQHQLVLHL